MIRITPFTSEPPTESTSCNSCLLTENSITSSLEPLLGHPRSDHTPLVIDKFLVESKSALNLLLGHKGIMWKEIQKGCKVKKRVPGRFLTKEEKKKGKVRISRLVFSFFLFIISVVICWFFKIKKKKEKRKEKKKKGIKKKELGNLLPCHLFLSLVGIISWREKLEKFNHKTYPFKHRYDCSTQISN